MLCYVSLNLKLPFQILFNLTNNDLLYPPFSFDLTTTVEEQTFASRIEYNLGLWRLQKRPDILAYAQFCFAAELRTKISIIFCKISINHLLGNFTSLVYSILKRRFNSVRVETV